MNSNLTLSTGPAAALALEGIKWLYCKIKKLPLDYPFSPKFYAIMLPVLNVAVVPLLALVGFEGYSLPTNWVAWVQSLAQVAIIAAVGSGVSLLVYAGGFRPLKDYAIKYNLVKAQNEKSKALSG